MGKYADIVKVTLGLACVIIVVPAWRLYLLPMSKMNGWKLGFVIDECGEEILVEEAGCKEVNGKYLPVTEKDDAEKYNKMRQGKETKSTIYVKERGSHQLYYDT